MKPIIGITPSPSDDVFDHGTFRRYCMSTTYVDAVLAVGGVPFIIPPSLQDLDQLYQTLDGIIFSGGSDLDPALFEEDAHETTYGIDPERDGFDLVAVREAVARDIPMLGICRGIQSINVALGGTLLQDIASSVPNAIPHRQHGLGKSQHETSHTVTIQESNNLLRQIHGMSEIETNSYHHQAVKRPAANLEVIATTSDGIIEAMWHPGMRFGLAVQWHPEMLAPNFPEHAAIFAALVEAAAKVTSRV
jgi:putative glutamine amidotransferase